METDLQEERGGEGVIDESSKENIPYFFVDEPRPPLPPLLLPPTDVRCTGLKPLSPASPPDLVEAANVVDLLDKDMS